MWDPLHLPSWWAGHSLQGVSSGAGLTGGPMRALGLVGSADSPSAELVRVLLAWWDIDTPHPVLVREEGLKDCL